MSPLFSIITVTYNAADTVERTLESVRSQSCGLYEHIIIDGASTDNTIEIIKKYSSDKVRVFSEPDRGLYDAMNKGITRSNGDYYIFMNAGDKFHSPDTLQHMADAIMANDYPGIVYGQTDLVDNEGRRIGPRHLTAPENLTFESFRDGMLVCHQAMAVYKEITVKYNIKYKYSADYDWVVICLMHSRRNVYLPEVVVDYLSEGMTTANHRESLKERFKIMCRYYGTLPTVFRHVKFLFRYLGRRNNAANIQ